MITFKALIDGVHFDPKKGTVKIQLVATSYVSMDKLITLGPRDESVRITLDSEQTKISNGGDLSTPHEDAVTRLEEAARELEESSDALDKVERKDPDEDDVDEDEDEVEGDEEGGII